MYRIIAVENVTLDGVMQAPGRPDEDTRGGFTYGGWAAEAFSTDPEAAQRAMQGRSEPGALLFGRRTYDDLVGHWLSTSEPNPFTEILTSTTKYVVSRDPGRQLPYPNSSLLPGEAAHTVADLKQQGEGELVVLGSGVRLFGDTRVPLEVEQTWTSRTGITVARYRVVRDA